MYSLMYLPSALSDILEADEYLFDLDTDVANKFAKALREQTGNLAVHPFMYQEYGENDYFRCMPLPYGYRLFYHVDEAVETVKVHRVLHGMRDLKRIL